MTGPPASRQRDRGSRDASQFATGAGPCPTPHADAEKSLPIRRAVGSDPMPGTLAVVLSR